MLGEERIIRLSDPKERQAVADFLAKFDLTFTEEVDYTFALYREEQIIGTGSLSGKVLRNVAIDPNLQGEGLMAKVISHLMAEGARRGEYGFQLFTKPDKVKQFELAGFRTVAIAEPYAALLEIGIGGIQSFCQQAASICSDLPPQGRAALVMNCNPFTLGHRALIAKATQENEGVILFVVQEDRSVFSFEDRINLVRQGTAYLKNVRVIPGGDYIISSATFPTYFVKGEEALAAQTELDVTIFVQKIAPSLEIQKRYVGEEPTDITTQAYNDALLKILPSSGVELIVMPRISVSGEMISASKVRKALGEDRWDDISKWVPSTTLRYLQSDQAAKSIQKIKNMTKK